MVSVFLVVLIDVLLFQLEILSTGGSLHEVAHIANGSHPRNCISLLRINVSKSHLNVRACPTMFFYLNRIVYCYY
jgi:hypothetical protein